MARLQAFLLGTKQVADGAAAAPFSFVKQSMLPELVRRCDGAANAGSETYRLAELHAAASCGGGGGGGINWLGLR